MKIQTYTVTVILQIIDSLRLSSLHLEVRVEVGHLQHILCGALARP
jgi:hypothetical protein